MEKKKLEAIRTLVPIVLVTILVIIAFVYLLKELAFSSAEYRVFAVSLFAMILLIGMNIFFMYGLYRVFQKNTGSVDNLQSRMKTRCPFEDIARSVGVPGDDAFCDGCYLAAGNRCNVREGYISAHPASPDEDRKKPG